MKYVLNHDAIIFLDSDIQDGYKTIAYDYKNDKILEISPPVYHLLKAIDSAGGVSEEDLEKLITDLSSSDDSLKKAVFALISRDIIIKNEH